jgi:dehydrogenase/reductase SDR family member 4
MNYKEAFNLRGKVALITGASRGIGEAIAHCYAAYGAKVVINSRKQEELDVVVSNIREAGGDCIGIAANAGDVKACQDLIDKLIAVCGGIDILVNNAATNPVYGPLLKSEEWAFDKIMSVNVKAPIVLANLAHPHMKRRGEGSVINISSIAGLTPDPGLGLYSISKAALNMLTKVQAKEWGADGIRVNSICPGLIKTKFSKALWSDPEILNRMVAKLPIARMGTVEEIAGLALYLASPVSGYCTGAVFTADGGTVL